MTIIHTVNVRGKEKIKRNSTFSLSKKLLPSMDLKQISYIFVELFVLEVGAVRPRSCTQDPSERPTLILEGRMKSKAEKGSFASVPDENA